MFGFVEAEVMETNDVSTREKALKYCRDFIIVSRYKSCVSFFVIVSAAKIVIDFLTNIKPITNYDHLSLRSLITFTKITPTLSGQQPVKV